MQVYFHEIPDEIIDELVNIYPEIVDYPPLILLLVQVFLRFKKE